MTMKTKHNAKRLLAIGVIAVLAVLILGLGMAIAHSPMAPDASSQGLSDEPLNIILLIGDGMGPGTRTAARYYYVGPDGQLAWEDFPFAGVTLTYAENALVTDSAAAATALATGHKTTNRRISMSPDGTTSYTTILEEALVLGKAAGIVSTSQVQHATPAAFYAHVPDRGQYDDIAAQMVDSGVNVFFGGGETYMLPDNVTGTYGPGHRTDGRNLIDEMVALGYVYVDNAADFAAIDTEATNYALGLFGYRGMERPFTPSLAEMTEQAINILDNDPDGFFLMVEGSQIDWANHGNDAENSMGDTWGFSEAVEVAKAFLAEHPNTLIIVTADHDTGGVAVEDMDDPAQDGPYPAVGGGEFGVDFTSTHHTANDVVTLATGPWSHLLAGTYQNTHIFDVMHQAFAVPPRRTATITPAADMMGYVDSRARLHPCRGTILWTGQDTRPKIPRNLHGCFQFDLGVLPANAVIADAEISLTQYSTRYAIGRSTYSLNLLPSDLDPIFKSTSGWVIAHATPDATLELGVVTPAVGSVDSIAFDRRAVRLLQERLLTTGKATFRLDGELLLPYGRDILGWDGRAGGGAPVLRVTYYAP
jgi:alkaline phosphatase